MSGLNVLRAGPLTTLQDAGRFGWLAQGISASGPMDRSGYLAAGALLGLAGDTAIEFSQALVFEAAEAMKLGAAGGQFRLSVNGAARGWLVEVALQRGDKVEIVPGDVGNYGYLRFDREIAAPLLLGSRSTNVAVGLGGHKGRALRAGDWLDFGATGRATAPAPAPRFDNGPIRVIWGIHVDLFDPAIRQSFVETAFQISPNLDRMGVRLGDDAGVFAAQRKLSLVSDMIVPGDIQILGDGTPIVLMRDHQPTGGYPRIATVVSADLDRFAQLRPGTAVRFRPVTLEHAR